MIKNPTALRTENNNVCVQTCLCVGDLRLVTPAGDGLYRRAHGYISSSSLGSGHGGTDATGAALLNMERCSAYHHVHGYTGTPPHYKRTNEYTSIQSIHLHFHICGGVSKKEAFSRNL